MSDNGTRVQLQLSDRHMSRLMKIMEITGYTKYAEAFRSALKVYEYLLDATREGAEIQIVRPDGTSRQVVIFLDQGEV
jgi:hypothetical protein